MSGNKEKRKSLSIRIQIICLRTLFLCLVFVFINVFVMQRYYQEHAFTQEMRNLTTLIARYSEPTLAFNDEHEALAVLEGLASDKRIVKAQLLNSNDQTLAVFNRYSIESSDAIFIKQPVIDQQIELGELQLWIDKSSYKTELQLGLAIMLVLGFISLGLAWWLSRQLPSSITQSVHELVQVFKNISESKNYTQRANYTDLVELDSLVHGFNLMIDEISARDEQLQQSQESLALALQGSGEGLWDCDLAGGWIYCDARCYELIGLEDPLKKQRLNSWLKRINRHGRRELIIALTQHLKSGNGSFEVECRIDCYPTGSRWFIIHGMITNKNGKNILRISGTVMDNHERHRAVEESQILAAVFQNTHEPVVVINADLIIEASNQSLSKRIEGQVQGLHIDTLLDDHYDGNFFEELNHHLKNDACWEGEVRLRDLSGGYRIMWLSLVPVGGSNKHNYLGTFSIIEQRQKIEDELRYLANYDSLTNLPNRRLFNERLNHALMLAKRHNNHLAIYFIDINNFKTINDTLGHNVGDLLLQQTAELLNVPLRETDTVARLGGDEFVVLTEHSGTQEQSEIIAQRLIEMFQEPVSCGKHKVMSSISVGIACYPGSSDTMEGLLINADLAMYQAKQAKANSFSFFRQEWAKEAERREILKQELTKAIEYKQFHLVLQPKFDLNSLLIHSAEALLRWEHPTLGMVSPAEFIPIAEEYGLIESIGNWVLEKTAQILQSWKSWKSGTFSDFSIAVNVSAVQFEEKKLLNILHHLTEKYDFETHLLELELTESLLLKSGDSSQALLQKIKERGFLISIDDFGTGYSSLQYLCNFPVNYLKIDQSFVHNLTNDERSIAIVKAIVAMAKGLNMSVIAEGIETEQQLQLLATMNCEFGQGYWCSPPLKTEKFEYYTNDWNEKYKQQRISKNENI